MMTSRTTRKTLASLAALSIVLMACGDDETTSDTAAPAATSAPAAASTPTETAAPTETEAPAATEAPASSAAAGGDLSSLADACKTEGKVNLVALPDEWANYKGILQSFRDKYPDVENPVANPNFSSQEELDAIVNLAGQDDMPDSIDVSPAKAKLAVDEGLWEPFQPSTWDEIPDNLKDPAGNWIAAYYGIMSIGTNTTIVPNAPKTWADLKKPEYKGQVALNGDPRSAGSAFAAVMAASLANGGSADDILPGIQFFADLKAAGNLIPTEVTQATVLSGETPIALDWSYNYPGLAKQIEDAGYTVEVNFPSDGVYGGFYSQGVVKNSPHQACSKLWVEHILSDEGALGYLEGGAMPARFAALEDAGKITEEAKKNLPPADLLAKVSFLTEEQVTNANAVLTEQWGPMVADA
jgi:putative spermidine/putrescine transport system substrate-binding protein